jgi:hypothetical protein
VAHPIAVFAIAWERMKRPSRGLLKKTVPTNVSENAAFLSKPVEH